MPFSSLCFGVIFTSKAILYFVESKFIVASIVLIISIDLSTVLSSTDNAFKSSTRPLVSLIPNLFNTFDNSKMFISLSFDEDSSSLGIIFWISKAYFWTSLIIL